MFLSTEEMRDLTGLIYNKSQVKWLAKRGYKFEIAVSGAPKVMKSYIEERLGKVSIKATKTKELNFSNSKYFG